MPSNERSLRFNLMEKGHPISAVCTTCGREFVGTEKRAADRCYAAVGRSTMMIVDSVLEPTALAHLPYKKGKTYEDYLGLRGLKRMGKKKWRRHVARIAEELKIALEAEYVVLG